MGCPGRPKDWGDPGLGDYLATTAMSSRPDFAILAACGVEPIWQIAIPASQSIEHLLESASPTSPKIGFPRGLGSAMEARLPKPNSDLCEKGGLQAGPQGWNLAGSVCVISGIS